MILCVINQFTIPTVKHPRTMILLVNYIRNIILLLILFIITINIFCKYISNFKIIPFCYVKTGVKIVQLVDYVWFCGNIICT